MRLPSHQPVAARAARCVACALLTLGLLGATTTASAAVGDALRAALLLQASSDQAIERQVAALDAQLGVAPVGSELDRRLAQIVTYLGEVNGYTLNYRVYLAPQVNAVAFPNGEVRVFAGLMQLLDDDELTFVIGHEIAHVVKEHGMASMRRQQTRNLAGVAASLLGLPTAGPGLNTGLGALELHFGRSAELEADRFGQKLLEMLDLNPKAGVSALTKLAQANGSAGRVASWFSTHPDPLVRAETLDQATTP
ncbi:MAG: M48 family metalloprotease [Pseudomonadota bacterium]